MAGFFNTNWNIGNAFNSPFSMDQGELTDQESFLPMNKDGGGLVERPGGYGPTGTPTWGAPTGYDSSNMFAMNNNPYQTGANSFYNPYSFGQTTYGTQYGGGQQKPWWMNYNQNNSVVNPPNIPTTSIEPEPQGYSGGQGTGPDGKDLNYAETIKYFGLYDNAESALAAGDKQAAYRKDHMQWRSGTGFYEGKGKVEGENDGDYPGRPDLGIAGDKKRMADLMGFPSALVDQFKGLFSGGDSGMNSNFLNQERGVEGSVPMLPTQQQTMQSYLDDSQKFSMNNYGPDDLKAAIDSGAISSDRAEVLAPQEYDMMMAMLRYGERSGRGPSVPVPDLLKQSTYQDNTPRGMFPLAPTGEQLSQTYMAQDNNQSFNIADIPGAGIKLSNMGGGLQTNKYSANNNENIFIQNLIKNGTLAASDAPMAQLSPYGMTDNIKNSLTGNYSGSSGMTRPATEQEYASNVLNNEYPKNMFLQDYQKSLADTGTARIAAEKQAAEQAEADAFIAAQNERNREAAQAAAAEKERQATAAQARMNDRYETGPVPKNIFTTPKATTGYTTKDVNNSFAARRNIRNIFA